MGKREKQKPDGDMPFGSSRADWAIPGVDREPVGQSLATARQTRLDLT